MSDLKERASSKKIIFWLFLIIFVWLFATRLDETKHVLTVLSTGRWYWIAPALLCQLFFYPLNSFFIDYVFRIFRLKLGWRRILPVYIASKFTDVALPVATFGQVAIFLRSGKKQHISTLNTGIGISFVIYLEVLAFAIVALITLLILYLFGQTRAYLYVTLIILVLGVAFASLFLVKLVASRQPPNRIVLLLIRFIAKVAGYKEVKTEEIERIFREIGLNVEKKQNKIWIALGLGIATHAINILTLAFIFLAFVGQFNVLAIIAAYTAGLLYTIVSITPQGVGVVETVMITTIHSFGYDLPTAAVTTLVFRSLLYWLPVFAGFYCFSHLELNTTKLKEGSLDGQTAL